MIKEICIALSAIFYIYSTGLFATDDQSANKARQKRDVSQLSAKTFKKAKVSVDAFDKFGNRLLTRTWPKLVSTTL